jgi:hypothetical protein
MMMTTSSLVSAFGVACFAVSVFASCAIQPDGSADGPVGVSDGGKANGTGGAPPKAGSAGRSNTGGSGAVAGKGSGSGGSGGQASGGSGGSAPATGGTSPVGSGGTAPGTGGTSATGGSAGQSNFPDPPSDKPDTIEVGVQNNCSFPLWIHAEGKGGVLTPDDQEIKPKATRWYDAPKAWEAARVTAFVDGPRQHEIEKVEMTFAPNATGVTLNYNVTYVDWLGLPVEVTSVGSGIDCKPAGCHVKQSEVLSGCPSGLLEGKKCMAARSYCLNAANQSKPYCNLLNDELKKCATKPGCEGAEKSNTAEIYACSGFFAEKPKWCAALNRNMLDDPFSVDRSKYYTKAPYNDYAKWVQQVCPGIYAFPYDDFPSNGAQSGFHACDKGKQLRITFCPAG